MNEVLKAIQDRRSTRGFSDVQLTEEQLSALMDAALASPTARNTQYWHFSFVQDQKILDEMNEDLTRIRRKRYEIAEAVGLGCTSKLIRVRLRAAFGNRFHQSGPAGLREFWKSGCQKDPC